jgi:hypothetical protein
MSEKTIRPIFCKDDIIIPHILPKHLSSYLGFAGSDGWKRLEKTETPNATRERKPEILCCRLLNYKDDSTLKTYGCFGRSSRHFLNGQSSVNVFDISCLFPSSALAGAVLKDPVAIDYYAERYFLLRGLDECSDMAEAFSMAPHFHELKTNPGEFCVGDACKVFESPSPQFKILCQHLADAEHDTSRHFFRESASVPAICILFTVGPIFNKLFVTDTRHMLGKSSDSEVPLVRECAVRLAQKKARMLKRWISHVQPEVNPRSRDWIRTLEHSVLLQGDQGASSGVEQVSSDLEVCLEMMEEGTDLRWARCTTEEVAATSRILAPVNRRSMCTSEYSPKDLNGKRSAYQSLLSSQTLPKHECVEVTLLERVAAHIRALSSQPLAFASPEEKSMIINRSLQALYPGNSWDCMSQSERMALFSPFCAGVAGALQAEAAVRDAGCLVPVLCDGAERVMQVVSMLSCCSRILKKHTVRCIFSLHS